MRCGYCGSTKHPTNYCRKSAASSNRLHLRFTYCGGRDHNYEGCTKHAGGGHMAGAVRLLD